jgi:hypothetical protein
MREGCPACVGRLAGGGPPASPVAEALGRANSQAQSRAEYVMRCVETHSLRYLSGELSAITLRHLFQSRQ